MVLLLVFGAIGAIAWMARPIRLHPHQGWLDPSVDAFGLLSLDSYDEGMGQLTTFVMKRLGTQMKQRVPENEQKVVAATTAVARKSFSQFVHPEIAFLLSYGEEQQAESRIAIIQFRNRMAVLLSDFYLSGRLANAPVVETTDTAAVVYQIASEASRETSPRFLALSGRTLLLSNSVPMVVRAGEKARVRGPAEGASEQLQPYIEALALDQPAPGRDLAFAAATPPGRITGWLNALEESLAAEGLTKNLESALTAKKVSLDEIRGITLSGDVISADRITFTATLYGSRSDKAKLLADALRLSLNQILARIEGAAATGGLNTTLDVKHLGTSVILGLQVSGVQKLIERWIPVDAPPPAATEQAASAEVAE